MKQLSLKTKLFLLLCGLLSLQVLLVWGLSRLFLPAFYRGDKEAALQSAYESVAAHYRDGTLSEMDAALENQNIRAEIWSRETGLLYASRGLEARLFVQNPPFPGGEPPPGAMITQPVNLASFLEEALAGQTKAFLEEPGGPMGDISQLQLAGRLDEGVYLLLRTALQPISEAAGLATRFSFMAGGLSLVVGLVITLFAVGLLIRPLAQMTRVARDLAALDFSARCETGARDEIGLLGQSVNTMADALQEYIGRMHRANEALTEDVRERIRMQEAQKELISNISHELKTPLSLMMGYAEGLRAGMAVDGATRRDYCDVIVDEGQRMNRLIAELLDLFKLQSGRTPPVPVPFDVGELAEGLARRFGLPAAERGLKLTNAVPQGVTVTADPDAAEQVLRNYLQNALRHAARGGLVELSCADAGDRVRISVYNDGASIPDEHLPRLWDSFFRGDAARGREHGQAGLGLAIVKAQMERQGLGYGAENRIGGVVFWMELKK